MAIASVRTTMRTNLLSSQEIATMKLRFSYNPCEVFRIRNCLYSFSDVNELFWLSYTGRLTPPIPAVTLAKHSIFR